MSLPVQSEIHRETELADRAASERGIRFPATPGDAAEQSEPGAGPLTLRGVTFAPARFCAPMAGLTHSAFRRLVADFGGHGGLFTEMLCGRWLLREDLRRAPTVKRRPAEGRVIYQLMLAEAGEVAPVVARLAEVSPDGLDLNCACPAPKVRLRGAGSELFADGPRLGNILTAMRREWPGLLTVKIRLGPSGADWRTLLGERLRQFEDLGVDAVTIHPRFADEKLKRRARHELFPELAACTRLPLIASGDLHSRAAVQAHATSLMAVAGIMIGRMAVVQPWLFRAWSEPGFTPDHAEVWRRFVRYVREDFPEQKVFHRVKAFTAYFARNFQFGHSLFAVAQAASHLAELENGALAFLEARPPLARQPDVTGLA